MNTILNNTVFVKLRLFFKTASAYLHRSISNAQRLNQTIKIIYVHNKPNINDVKTSVQSIENDPIGIENQWEKYNNKPLTITNQEWAAAEVIMQKMIKEGQPLPTKIDKKNFPQLNHSFIVLNGEDGIQCMAIARSKDKNEGVLAYGKQGVWKILQAKDNSQVVMKVEPHVKSDSNKHIKELSQYISSFTRKRNKKTTWVTGRTKVKQIKDKQYSIFKKIDGISLSSFVENQKNQLTTDEKKMCDLAYQCAIALQSFHHKNLIHGDLHGENILVNKNNKCELVDFGTLHKLAEGEASIDLEKPVGSRSFMAPEVGIWDKEKNKWKSQQSKISLSSDIYSLARVFEKNMNISKLPGFDKLIKRMKKSNPDQRPDIDSVIQELNNIKTSYENKAEKNKSVLTISVGQALLLLTKHYKDADPDYCKKLEKLYMLGFRTDEDTAVLKKIKNDPLLKEYDVSDNYAVISGDASRRYFETHLSFETMKTAIKDYPLDTIQKHYDSIKSCFESLGGDIDFQKFKKTGKRKIKRDYKKEENERIKNNLDCDNLIKGISKEEQKEIDKLFSGNLPSPKSKKYKNAMYMEYADMVKRVKENKHLSEEDKQKYLLIVKSTRLSMILNNKMEKYKNKGTYDGELMPGDYIYKSGIYSPENRGRISKNAVPGSNNMGLLLADMPLDKSDDAYSERSFPYPKPSDISTFNSDSKWIKYAMDQKVHAFSNSISGTLLAQLRAMLKLHKENKLSLKDKEDFSNHFRSMISLMTYMTGGHSLLEFTAPLQLKDVIEEFKFIEGFGDLSLESLFFTGNDSAYEKALKKAQDYNDKYISALKEKKENYFYDIPKLNEPTLLNQFKLSNVANNLDNNVIQANLSDYSHLNTDNILQNAGLIAMMQKVTGKSAIDLVTFNSDRALLHEVSAFVTSFIKTENEQHRNEVIRKICNDLSSEDLSELDDALKGIKNEASNDIQKIMAGKKKGKKVYKDAIAAAKKMKFPCSYCTEIDSVEKLAFEIASSQLIKDKQENFLKKTVSNYFRANPFYQYKSPAESDKPIVMFAAGGQGSGKGSTISNMLYEAEQKGIDPRNFVYLNNDSYKDLLKNSTMNSKIFSQLTHAEARLIRDKAYNYAKDNHQHIMLDQVNPSMSALNYAQSKDGVIKGIFISTKVDEAMERCFKRGQEIGRFEDTQSILKCHKEMPKNAKNFLMSSIGKKAHVDFYDNNAQSTLFMSVNCFNREIIIQDISLLKQFIQKNYINLNSKRFDELYNINKISDSHLEAATNEWLDSLQSKGYQIKYLSNKKTNRI